MTDSPCYQANTEKVIFEDFSGEVVLINLESGNYFNFSQVGYDIWELILQGRTIAEIESLIAKAYSQDVDAIHEDVSDFIDSLLNDEIIVAAEAPAQADGEGPSREGIAYSKPVLNKFTDMNELLLVDPIHDVSDEGWPKRDA